jgi:hypothetical protein
MSDLKPLDKYQNLIVRTCKRGLPLKKALKRFKRIWSIRVACLDEHWKNYLIEEMAKILKDTPKEPTPLELLGLFDPVNQFRVEGLDYHDTIISFYRERIGHTDPNLCWSNYDGGAYWRNKRIFDDISYIDDISEGDEPELMAFGPMEAMPEFTVICFAKGMYYLTNHKGIIAYWQDTPDLTLRTSKLRAASGDFQEKFSYIRESFNILTEKNIKKI